MAEPLVSILIATYNYGHFIEEAIDSVLAQDCPADRFEILVIDDGSTDDTAARVKKYGSRVQYLYKPNGGQASAFNFAIDKTRGEIIAMLDGDDYWFPDRLRTVLDEFEKHPEAGVVYHPLREFHMRTGEFKEHYFTPISGFVPSDIKQVILFDGVMTTNSYRRNILQQLLPIPEKPTIQADAYIGNLAIFLAPVVAIDRSLGIYRIHDNNIYFQAASTANRERTRWRIDTRYALVAAMTVWFKSHGYDLRDPAIQASLLRWIILSERDEFELSPPGRIKFVRHLLKSYRHTGPLMTPKIRVVNYLNAIGALFVGYKRFHMLDETRQKVSRWLRHGNPLSSYLRGKSVRRHELER